MTIAKRHILLAGVALCWSMANAVEVCEFVITQCPEQLNGATLVVPEKVVALSAEVKACPLTGSQTSSRPADRPPSVLFVIDHSGSMTGEGSGRNDVYGSRFTVTRALLDTIFRTAPSAEVGLVVFREHLFFDRRTPQNYSTYFKTMPESYDGESNQAYLPYLTLNGTYGGRRGIDILKDILATDTVGSGDSRHVDLLYRPLFESTLSTNINVAFAAVRDALPSAKNPPERRFVVFLSDGEPQGSSQAGRPAMDFARGEGMPTTFTVYFTSSGTPPQSLITMTQNIRSNNYSSANPASNLWTIETSHSALLRLLMENVMSTIMTSGRPVQMTLNGMRSTAYDGGEFLFADRFMLAGSTTSFTMSVTYRVVDTLTGQQLPDSVLAVNFSVRRSQSGEPVSPGVEIICWSDSLPPPGWHDPDPGSVSTPITIGVSSNPFVPGATEIPPPVRRRYLGTSASPSSGVVIAVTTERQLQQLPGGTYGKAQVYDAVGNLVRTDLGVVAGTVRGEYAVVWDGTNGRGRLVGAGAYLVCVKMKAGDGAAIERRVKIGVRRK